MSKFNQIGKLATAAQIVQEVSFNYQVTDTQAAKLQKIVEQLAEIADEIEGVTE